MLSSLFSQLAFIGDLHPVAVHFPIALLPTVLLLKLANWRSRQPWLERGITLLLGLALAFAAVAVALGFTTRAVNGFRGEAVVQHYTLALGSLLLIAVSFLMHWREQWVLLGFSALSRLLRVVIGSAVLLLKGFWKILKWLLVVLLLPLFLLYLLVRMFYRRFLAASWQPHLQRSWQRVQAAISRVWQGLRRLNTTALWKNASYAVALVLILLTGMKGANLSHGEGHLTRNMSPALAAWFGAEQHSEANLQLDQAYYEQELLPVFRRSCVKCHGEDKQKAGLRLDSYQALINSGAVRWQDPYGSELIKRILLPRDDASAMPPAGKSRELHTEDIGSIVAWLQGHSLESLAQQDGGMPAELKRVANSLAPVSEQALQQLNEIDGLHVLRLVDNYDLLVANLRFVPESLRATALDALQAYTGHIVDLDMAGWSLAPRERQFVSSLTNLQRLNLSGSPLSDDDVQTLSSLNRLQWLNIFNTAVTLSADALRAALPGLQTVYLPAEAQVTDS